MSEDMAAERNVGESLAEMSKPDPGKVLLDCICNEVVNALDISWKDRDVVKGLLKTSLQRNIHDLLQQYLNTELQEVGRTFNKVFGIAGEVERNFSTHAKMKDFIWCIMEKYQIGTEHERKMKRTGTREKKIKKEESVKAGRCPNCNSDLIGKPLGCGKCGYSVKEISEG